jgi:hypothetical protein
MDTGHGMPGGMDLVTGRHESDSAARLRLASPGAPVRFYFLQRLAFGFWHRRCDADNSHEAQAGEEGVRAALPQAALQQGKSKADGCIGGEVSDRGDPGCGAP